MTMLENAHDALRRIFSDLARDEQAKYQALQTNIRASELRLDDFVKQEAAAQLKFQKVSAELEQAVQDRDQALRDAAAIRSTALGERDRILAEAHREAADRVEDAELAVAVARDALGKRKRPAA